MTGVISPRTDILPRAQQQLWPQLRAAAAMGFVLYGGTAIALRLGHRVSVDFDFFSDAALDRDAIRVALPFTAQSLVLQDERNTFTVRFTPGDQPGAYVKVSFFGAIGFGRVGEPDITHDAVLQIASPEDLMATKLKVLLQRAEAKDYRDIAALIAAGVDLSKGLAAARALFGMAFQPSECLKALVYFEDGDLNTLTKAEKTGLIAAVRAVRELPDIAILNSRLAVPVA
jgi:Nucleotidyl transferase AbiEii toxin, Type IV TA system